MPSSKQLRWAQLRVGITVIFAAVVLMYLIFLMGGTTGFFTPTVRLLTYVNNAGGLRNGAPVRLQNVDIGNVATIRLVNHTDANGVNTPVQIAMTVNAKFRPFLHTDSVVYLTTAGVLGETFVDIDSTNATGPEPGNGAELPSRSLPALQDVVAGSKVTLENVNALLKRVDNIVGAIEDQRGSVGKLIYDKELYNNINSSVTQVNQMLTEVNKGNGSLGKLIKDDTLYLRANSAIEKVNKMVDDINSTQGTIGKLIHDPSLYDNANQTAAKASDLIGGIDQGKGALGMFARDKEFADKLNRLVSSLGELSAGLNEGKGTAGKLIKDPKLYDDLDNLMLESRQLVSSVRKDPKKYLSIKLHIF